MWFSGNYVELNVTRNHAAIGAHPGPCDDDISYLRTMPSISRNLAKLDPEALRKELKEYGAWNETELADHDANLSRILWLACSDIMERI